MKLKAFSLLELIIVLAVLAIIMGLGWSGLINFRSTAEMQNAYSELLSVIKTQQNKAKNSTSATNQEQSGVTTPYFYTLFFANNKYYAFNCGTTTNSVAAPKNPVRCTKDTTVTFRLLPVDIKITPDSNCQGIGFAKLTGKFTSFTLPAGSNMDSVTAFDSTYSSSGTCNIRISHTQITTEKVIEINLDINNINAK